MEIRRFTYKELEKGYKGIIDRFGNFYAIDRIENIDPIHQEKIPKHLKDIDVNILEIFQKLSEL